MKKQPLTETTYYILLSLLTSRHGYGIIKNVEELSQGTVILAAGTLYGALENLKSMGYVEQLAVDATSRRKNYKLTSMGYNALYQDYQRMINLITISAQLLKEREE